MLTTSVILFYLVILFANIAQGITGFAGTVLAMPFSLMLVGYDVAKPILNFLGIAVSIGILCSNPKAVNKYEFAKILSIMLIGILIGAIVTKYINLTSQFLYILLGLIVIAFSIIGIFTIPTNTLNNDKPNIFTYIILVISGLIHGIYVCGGPLLVIYATRTLKDKEEFRTTLSAVWIVLNSLIFIQDLNTGYFTLHTNWILLVSSIVLVIALIVGNLLAKKMNQKIFMIITYILMLASGISLIIK